MQPTSEIYNQIVASGDYYTETRVGVGANHLTPETAYDEEELISVKTQKNVFSNNRPEVGCCIMGEIDLEMYAPNEEIEKRAPIVIYIRLISNEDETLVSEWLEKGHFMIDTREKTENSDGLDILTIHGYDAMAVSEQEYGDSGLQFPTDAVSLVNDIALKMGITVDSRCIGYLQTPVYEFQYPAQYTLRETLGFIGMAYAGNFVINDMGKLQFIPLWALPLETNFLIDQIGNRIVFGEDEYATRILV